MKFFFFFHFFKPLKFVWGLPKWKFGITPEYPTHHTLLGLGLGLRLGLGLGLGIRVRD